MLPKVQKNEQPTLVHHRNIQIHFLVVIKLTHVNIFVLMFQDFDENPMDESNTTFRIGKLPFLTYKISLFSFFLSTPSEHSSMSQQIFLKKKATHFKNQNT